MQILMRGAICGTEYSCGHRARRPRSGPNVVFFLPSLFWHADKEQQGKEQGGESKVRLWRKFAPNFTTPGNGTEGEMKYFHDVRWVRDVSADVKSKLMWS